MNHKRNYGVDLLRIIAMLMVVCLHVLAKGGVLWAVDRGSLRYILVWLLEVASFCAVNVYALISGYVGWKSKARCSRMIMLWLQVVWYTVLITFLFTLKNPEQATVSIWKGAVFPIFTRQYWYITSYFGLCLILPCLHWIVEKITIKEAKILGWGVFVVFSVLPSILQTDPFMTGKGYSLLWIALLYVAGACINKYEFFSRWSRKKIFLVYSFSIVFSWGSKIVIERIIPRVGDKRYDMTFIEYTAPTMVIAAVMLLVLFAKLNITKKIVIRLITIISPATLGVYIIHEQPFIKKYVITGISEKYAAATNSIYVLLGILLTVLLVFVTCVFIELIRIKFFKLIHVEDNCRMIDKKIENWCK